MALGHNCMEGKSIQGWKGKRVQVQEGKSSLRQEDVKVGEHKGAMMEEQKVQRQQGEIVQEQECERIRG